MIWDIVEYHDGIDIKNIISNVWYLPSGKRLQFAIENGPVEIVDLPLIACWFSIVFCMFTRGSMHVNIDIPRLDDVWSMRLIYIFFHSK